MTDKIGDDAGNRATFDPEARARIRSILKHYMDQHDIGVPALLARIANATGRDIDLIPQKTLQRFLAGTHRTNDASLILLHAFTKNLPVPEAVETDALARALAAYYRPPPSVPPGDPAPARLPPGVLRIYDRILRPGRSASETCGELIVEPEDKNGTVRIRERLFKPGAVRSEPGGDPPAPHYHYEGVLVSLPPLQLAVMRSRHSRLPRVHWIKHNPPAPLYSHCLEAVFHPASSDAVAATMLRLEPQTGGP